MNQITFHDPDHRSDYWKITARSDIIIRMRRFFPGARMEKGKIEITDSPSIRRDLEAMMVRFDFSISEEDDRRIRSGAEFSRTQESDVLNVLNGYTPPTDQWLEYGVEPYQYQADARDLALTSGGLLVADDLGMGKTITSLSTLAKPGQLPALIVVIPGRLPDQWEKEARRMYPDLTVAQVSKRTPYALGNPDITICTYSKLSDEWAQVFTGKMNTVIFDEIHEIRNRSAIKSRNCSMVASEAKTRIGLSATPIWNKGDETWAVMHALCPEVMGTRDEFLREWGGAAYFNGSQDIADPEALKEMLVGTGHFIQRTEEDIEVDLPHLNPIEYTVPYDLSVIEQGESSAIQIARAVLRSSESTSGNSWSSYGQLDMRMRQATGLAKAPSVITLVEDLAAKDKVLLFGWHRDVYEMWQESLEKAGVPYVMFTGSERGAQKSRAFKEFVEGDARVLIMSLRSGAGLDGLQEVCHTLVFGELEWSDAAHTQAAGRLRRPGQTHDVDVWTCVADGGADPLIMDLHAHKRVQTDPFNYSAGGPVGQSMDRGDALREMARQILGKHVMLDDEEELCGSER